MDIHCPHRGPVYRPLVTRFVSNTKSTTCRPRPDAFTVTMSLADAFGSLAVGGAFPIAANFSPKVRATSSAIGDCLSPAPVPRSASSLTTVLPVLFGGGIQYHISPEFIAPGVDKRFLVSNKGFEPS
ncbi:hypothetical protein TRVL_09834 [Trypanosoma vivax]|nr:hypothetical protein TRVL_09834 [Trypanosoma vivax]